jgi:long-subunit acyl-CoA synthetase (AMP-forming)
MARRYAGGRNGNGDWQSATGLEKQELVNSLISGLDALGAIPGDRIGILSSTRWEWMAADWAVLGLGAVTVTLYPSKCARDDRRHGTDHVVPARDGRLIFKRLGSSHKELLVLERSYHEVLHDIEQAQEEESIRRFCTRVAPQVPACSPSALLRTRIDR